MSEKKITREEAIELSKEYFNGDELAASVFVDKYALKDNDGNLLESTPTEMHHRLAKEFARIDLKYPNPMSEEEYFDAMDKFQKIIPQGSPMSGIGNDNQTISISNCFVIGAPKDSYGGIMKADEELVQLMKRRAGVGLDVSHIRPKGLATRNAAKTTDGIAVFMERFSNSCREVAQGGRRGALMLSISVNHPEVETFITIKNDKTKVTGANISIRINDEFMEAVKADGYYEQRWPVDSDSPKIKKSVKAKPIWEKIIHNAWASAEPGLLFWDTVHKNGPADQYPEFKSVSTNPCYSGEETVLTGHKHQTQ
jgi:ribonucleoside-diphosphate reductase alpha chain